MRAEYVDIKMTLLTALQTREYDALDALLYDIRNWLHRISEEERASIVRLALLGLYPEASPYQSQPPDLSERSSSHPRMPDLAADSPPTSVATSPRASACATPAASSPPPTPPISAPPSPRAAPPQPPRPLCAGPAARPHLPPYLPPRPPQAGSPPLLRVAYLQARLDQATARIWALTGVLAGALAYASAPPALRCATPSSSTATPAPAAAPPPPDPTGRKVVSLATQV